MKKTFFLLIFVCVYNFLLAQQKDGYLIVIDRARDMQPCHAFQSFETADLIYVDSIKAFNDSIFLSNYSQFISRFLFINKGYIVTNNPCRPQNECPKFTFDSIPQKALFKTFDFEFSKYSQRVNFYIFRIKSPYCQIREKNGLSYWFKYFVKAHEFIRLKSSETIYSEVDQVFMDKLILQINGFTYGYKFFDVGYANHY